MLVVKSKSLIAYMYRYFNSLKQTVPRGENLCGYPDIKSKGPHYQIWSSQLIFTTPSSHILGFEFSSTNLQNRQYYFMI